MLNKPVPLKCCFDGNFHTVEGKVRYSGGTTLIIRVDPSITYMDLLSTLTQKGRNPTSSSLQVRYKYPGDSLDSTLVDIYEDEAVRNMMAAFEESSSSSALELYISTKLADTSTLESIPARSLQKEANVSNKGAILQRGGTSTACLPIPLNDAIPPSQDTSHVSSQSSKSILKKGLEFPNLDSLKIAVREASILGHFKIKTKRTDSKHYRVECADENCSWHMHAVWVGESCFRIRSLKEEHKCSRTPGQATEKWIAKFTRDHRMENAETNQIMEEIKTRHGMDVNYDKARRGKLLASKEIQKDQSESVGTVGGGKRARMSKRLGSGKRACEPNGSQKDISESVPSEEMASEFDRSQDLGPYENQQSMPPEIDHTTNEGSTVLNLVEMDVDGGQLENRSGKNCAEETKGSREQILEQSTSSETLMGCDSGSYPMMSKDQLEKIGEYCKKILETPFSASLPRLLSYVNTLTNYINTWELPVHQRSDAVSSMVYEANARVRDPVYGCVGIILSLQKQVDVLQTQLALAQAEVIHMRLRQATTSISGSLVTGNTASATASPSLKLIAPHSRSMFTLDMDLANMGESLWA